MKKIDTFIKKMRFYHNRGENLKIKWRWLNSRWGLLKSDIEARTIKKVTKRDLFKYLKVTYFIEIRGYVICVTKYGYRKKPFKKYVTVYSKNQLRSYLKVVLGSQTCTGRVGSKFVEEVAGIQITSYRIVDRVVGIKEEFWRRIGE